MVTVTKQGSLTLRYDFVIEMDLPDSDTHVEIDIPPEVMTEYFMTDWPESMGILESHIRKQLKLEGDEVALERLHMSLKVHTNTDAVEYDQI